jgi:hypothetical protein
MVGRKKCLKNQEGERIYKNKKRGKIFFPLIASIVGKSQIN